MSAVCPQLDFIKTLSLPDDLPWTIQKPHIDLHLSHQKKHVIILTMGLYIPMDRRQKIGCDGDYFIIFTDSLSSLQALDSNNCDHPMFQDTSLKKQMSLPKVPYPD